MILLVAPESYKQSLFPQQREDENHSPVYYSNVPVADMSVTACIDLLFDNTAERIAQLEKISSGVVVVNLIAETGKHLPDNFVRINGWPGFWQKNIVECAAKNSSIKVLAEDALSELGKTIEWTPDIPGFISARILSAIINEAYFTLEEGVSSKEEIDMAMKLGTNYPSGPFEWGKKIGLNNILSLLNKMAEINSRYKPAALLEEEAQLS